jgi:acyl-coenzyme A thioesterase PaaI-like protein
MAKFEETWVERRVATELDALGLDLESVRELPQPSGMEKHFVVGADKQGVLWTFESGFVDDAEKRVLVAVRFHEPAKHVMDVVHGGAISAVIDAFAAVCGVIQLGWDMRAVTKEQTIRFRRPLRLETTYLLVARSWDATDADGAAHVTSVIVDEEGKTRIEADTVMVIPKR